ncbi:MAG: hypothetical protein HQK49_12140 [Oligoflexia bacterium]|nr:hypothetical protein [Oligoflexia bacterium]
MRGYIKSYLLFAAHPFKYQSYLRKIRLGDLPRREEKLDGECECEYENVPTLHLGPAIAIAWIFVILKSLLIIIFLNISYEGFVRELGSFEELILIFKGGASEKEIMPIVAFSIVFFRAVYAIFFPVIAFIHALIMEAIISFMVRLSGIHENVRSRDDVIANLFCSYLFCPIPVIGNLAQKIAFFVYLYAGLKNNYKFSLAYMFVVICIPFFLLLAFFTLAVIFFKLIM